jgi:F0F1-type ATP synthase membrane subunit b/b'
MNQSRIKIQYDSNYANCYAVTGLISDYFINQTFFNYQLVGPSFVNTSWSDWENISCLSSLVLNQSRTKIQYDIYGCFGNITFTEYRTAGNCSIPCTTNITTFFTEWQNISCLPSNLMNQTRNKVEYDLNGCGIFANTTYIEERQSLACVYSSGDENNDDGGGGGGSGGGGGGNRPRVNVAYTNATNSTEGNKTAENYSSTTQNEPISIGESNFWTEKLRQRLRTGIFWLLSGLLFIAFIVAIYILIKKRERISEALKNYIQEIREKRAKAKLAREQIRKEKEEEKEKKEEEQREKEAEQRAIEAQERRLEEKKQDSNAKINKIKALANPFEANAPENESQLREQDELIKKRINVLLIQGKSYVEMKLFNRADETYNEIKALYSKLHFADKELYSKLIDFYKTLK